MKFLTLLSIALLFGSLSYYKSLLYDVDLNKLGGSNACMERIEKDFPLINAQFRTVDVIIADSFESAYYAFANFTFRPDILEDSGFVIGYVSALTRSESNILERRCEYACFAHYSSIDIENDVRDDIMACAGNYLGLMLPFIYTFFAALLFHRQFVKSLKASLAAFLLPTASLLVATRVCTIVQSPITFLSIVTLPIIVGQSIDVVFVCMMAGKKEAVVSVTVSTLSTCLATMYLYALSGSRNSMTVDFYMYMATALFSMLCVHVCGLADTFYNSFYTVTVLKTTPSRRTLPKALLHIPLILAMLLGVDALVSRATDYRIATFSPIDFLTDDFDKTFLPTEYPSVALAYEPRDLNSTHYITGYSPNKLLQVGEKNLLVLTGSRPIENYVASEATAEEASRAPAECVTSRELNVRSLVISLLSVTRKVCPVVFSMLLLFCGGTAASIATLAWCLMVAINVLVSGVTLPFVFVHAFSSSMVLDYVVHAKHAPIDSYILVALWHSMATTLLALYFTIGSSSVKIIRDVGMQMGYMYTTSWLAAVATVLVRRCKRTDILKPLLRKSFPVEIMQELPEQRS